MKIADYMSGIEARHQERIKTYSKFPRVQELTDEAKDWLLLQNTHDIEAFVYGALNLKTKNGYYLAAATVVNPAWKSEYGDFPYVDGPEGRTYHYLPARLAEFDDLFTDYQKFAMYETQQAKELQLDGIVIPRFHEWIKTRTAEEIARVQAVFGV